MDGNLLVAVHAAIRVAFGILADKWLTTLALIMTAVLYGWAMLEPSYLHFAMAGAFGLTTFIPVLWVGHIRSHPHEAARAEEK